MWHAPLNYHTKIYRHCDDGVIQLASVPNIIKAISICFLTSCLCSRVFSLHLIKDTQTYIKWKPCKLQNSIYTNYLRVHSIELHHIMLVVMFLLLLFSWGIFSLQPIKKARARESAKRLHIRHCYFRVNYFD